MGLCWVFGILLFRALIWIEVVRCGKSLIIVLDAKGTWRELGKPDTLSGSTPWGRQHSHLLSVTQDSFPPPPRLRAFMETKSCASSAPGTVVHNFPVQVSPSSHVCLQKVFMGEPLRFSELSSPVPSLGLFPSSHCCIVLYSCVDTWTNGSEFTDSS